MGGGFGTDTEVMEKAVSEVQQVRQAVDSAVQTLNGEVEPALGGWQGQAAQVFRKLMDQFNQEAKTITQKLDEIGENIQGSSRDYAQQQEESAQEISKIEGMLNG
ncbi:WXG100 family type VII secretion target [Salinifilum aidingensis]